VDECKPLVPGVRAGGGGARAHLRGEAVQVEPMKSKLKAPGTTSNRLKLKYEKLLSSLAFNFNLRRYIVVHRAARDGGQDCDFPDGYSQSQQCQVRRCRLNRQNPS